MRKLLLMFFCIICFHSRCHALNPDPYSAQVTTITQVGSTVFITLSLTNSTTNFSTVLPGYDYVGQPLEALNALKVIIQEQLDLINNKTAADYGPTLRAQVFVSTP